MFSWRLGPLIVSQMSPAVCSAASSGRAERCASPAACADRAGRRLGPALVQMVKGAALKVFPEAPHGLCSTHKDQVNTDLLSFIKE
jgi:hypothetical protein